MAEYINKARLISHIEYELMKWGERQYDVQQVLGDIEDFTTADVEEVKHGEWVQDFDEDYYCSRCGRYPKKDVCDYCPNCGAKMDGGKTE